MPYLAPGNDTKDNKKWPTNNSSDSSTHDDKNTPTSTIHSSSISILHSSLQSRVKMSSSYDISGSDNVLGRRQQHKYDTLSPLTSTSPRRKSAPDVLKLPLPPKKTFNQQDDDQLVTIRKKSGEIVKSSLKKRSKSEPSTPLIPKYVHFNADLEQIRLFKEAREPQAVSADVSSDESDDDDDDDDDFFFSDNDDDDSIDQEPLLTISIPNMPPITTLHSSKPVFVESIYLSKDKRRLEGRIMVQNIAFRKLVEVRYTFDFWQTVSEVKANYAEGVIDKDDDRRSFDVFVFSIELFDNSRNPIDGKIMYFAVHYNVCNRDYWDNNSGSNYQVNFKKIKNSSSSSSQCNHHCYHKYYQYNNNNNNDNHKANRVSSSSSSNNNNNNNSSSRWPIISSTPVSNRQKSLNNDCHSPPAPASSTTHTSITDPRKRAIGRYDIGTSLSAAQNIASFSSTNNNNNKGATTTTTTNKAINNNNNNNNSPITTIMTTSPFTLTNNNAQTHANYYYHISKLTISCDPYGSFGAGNYIDGMPVTTETPLSSSLQWDDSPKGAFGGFPLISSNPIEIPSRKSSPINSTNNYYDHIISQYCFSSGSPYAISPSPFASSPTIHL